MSDARWIEDVDLRELRMFLVCAEELHFGRAAERQHVTTARISQTIAKLERQLGGTLFDRTSRRVALTPFGARVVHAVQPAYQDLLAAVHDVTQPRSGVGGTLRVGIYGMGWGTVLNSLLVRFRANNPRCRIIMVDLGLDEPLNRLIAGEVDVLATYLPFHVTGISVGPSLYRTTRCVLLAVSHPLAGRRTVCWDDLADYGVSEPINLPEQLRAAICPPVTPSGRTLRRTLRVTTFTETLVGVASGEIVHPTVATTADYVNVPGIVARPITDADDVEGAVMYRSGIPEPPVVAFLDVAEELARRPH